MGTKSNPYHVQSVNRLLPKIEFIHNNNNKNQRIENKIMVFQQLSLQPTNFRSKKRAHTHKHSDLHSTHIEISKQRTNKRRSPDKAVRVAHKLWNMETYIYIYLHYSYLEIKHTKYFIVFILFITIPSHLLSFCI